MNKFAAISVLVCGLVAFALSVAFINGAFDVRQAALTDVPVIPVDASVNIETDSELSVAQVIELPEIKIYSPSTITGAGAARRRATAVEAKSPEVTEGDRSSPELSRETRFSTEAARNYRPNLSHSVLRGVSLRFDSTKVGVPTYRPERNDEPIEIEIDMRH
jgi:hypothetical protein